LKESVQEISGGPVMRRDTQKICRVGGNYIKNEKLQTNVKRSNKAVCLEFHIRINLWVCSISRVSIVCIATRYGVDGPGIQS